MNTYFAFQWIFATLHDSPLMYMQIQSQAFQPLLLEVGFVRDTEQEVHK